MSKKINSVIKKTISIATSVATIAWLSGAAMILPVGAVTYADGSLLKTAASGDIWAVNNNLKVKVRSASVFTDSGYDWANVQTVSSSALTSVPTADLIKTSDNPDVYKLEKDFKRKLASIEIFNSYNLDWTKISTVSSPVMSSYSYAPLVQKSGEADIYWRDSSNILHKFASWEAFVDNGYQTRDVIVVNADEYGSFAVGDPITSTTPTTPATTGLSIALASDSPSGTVVARASVDTVFAKINFAAGTEKGYTVTTIKIARGGIADDDDVTDIKLYDGADLIGSAQALNTTTHKASFSGLSWAVPAGETKVLTVKATIGDSTNGTVGNIVKLGIGEAADVITTPEVTITGAPVYSNGMTIAGASVGRLDVVANAAPADSNIISGSTDQQIASFKFSAVNEGMSVTSITLTEIGTSVDSDVFNIKLKYLGEQVGSTQSALSNGKATFTGSPLFTVASGTNKDVDVYVDVATGVTSARTVRFQVTNYYDVIATGASSGGQVTITGSAGATFTTADGAGTMTIVQGSLSVTYDTATNLSQQTYIIGTNQNSLASFKFSAGSNEGIKITELRLNASGAAAATDYSNVRLYINSASASTGHTGSISGSVVTFTDGNGLFEVPKSGNTIVTVKADITTSAADTDTLGFYISAVTNLKIKGSTSNAEITSTTSNITLTSVGIGNATLHNIDPYGSLAVAKAADSPAATNYARGTTGFTFLKFTLSATGEDITVSSVQVKFWAGAVGGTAATTTAVSNVKLFDGQTQLGSTQTSANASGLVTFSINSTVSKNTTKTLNVVADIPTTNETTGLSVSIGQDGTVSDELTSTGVSSGSSSFSETGSASGSTMTLATASLTITMDTTPPAQTVVVNSTNLTVARFLFAASTAEDIKVTSITVRAATTTAMTLASMANTNFANIKLVRTDTSAQIGLTAGETKASFTDGTPDSAAWTGIENFTITKGTTVPVELRLDVSSSTAGPFYFGMAAATQMAAGSGLSSGSSITSTPGEIYSNPLTVATSGTLSVAVDSDTPVSSNVPTGEAGQSGVEFGKIKFSAGTQEAIKITAMTLTLDVASITASASTATSSGIANIAAVKLYDGQTPVGPTGYLGQNASSVAVVTYNFPTGSEITVPKGSYKVISVKGDLNGTLTGGTPGSALRFYLSFGATASAGTGIALAVTSEGSASGQAITETAGTPTPITNTNFNLLYLYKSVATVSKGSTSPAGSASPGANADVLIFDVVADSKGEVVVNTVALSVAGTAAPSGSGDAYLYWSQDSYTTALAREAYRVALNVSGEVSTTTSATSTSGAFDGIPVGATIFFDSNAGTDSAVTVTRVASSTATADAIYWTPAAAQALASSTDDIYYRPMRPGSGKVYFGGQTTLTADQPNANTVATTTSISGFAKGDVVRIKGYSATGTLVVGQATIKDFPSTTEIAFTAAPTAASGEVWFGTVDYNYTGRGSTSTDATSLGGDAVVYTVTRADGPDSDSTAEDALIQATVPIGATRTFKVKADTTGAAATTNLRVDISAITDFNWSDAVRFGINTLTKNLPITGGTLTY